MIKFTSLRQMYVRNFVLGVFNFLLLTTRLFQPCQTSFRGVFFFFFFSFRSLEIYDWSKIHCLVTFCSYHFAANPAPLESMKYELSAFVFKGGRSIAFMTK